MTYDELILNIDTYIKQNGNNEITGDVLNTVLNYISDYFKSVIGDETTLSTPNTDDLVKAINSVNARFSDITNGFIRLFEGVENPNTTPPLNFKNGDFYLEKAIDNTPLRLWQYNISEWVLVSAFSETIIQYLELKLYMKGSVSGVPNTGNDLEPGDFVKGLKDANTLWESAIYIGGDPNDRDNYKYCIEVDITGLPI